MPAGKVKMAESQPKTVTDYLRRLTGPPLARLAAALARAGLQADWLTIGGLLLVIVAAFFLARGEFLPGGLLLLVSLPLDALDGAVARAGQSGGAFGMVLDSTLDRYADGVIFAAFGYYFAVEARYAMLALCLAALVGSYLVSYIRARAEDEKVAVRVTIGLFTRLERVIVVLLMTFAAAALGDSRPLELGLLVLAVGTNVTALQRLDFVYRALKNRGE